MPKIINDGAFCRPCYHLFPSMEYKNFKGLILISSCFMRAIGAAPRS